MTRLTTASKAKKKATLPRSSTSRVAATPVGAAPVDSHQMYRPVFGSHIYSNDAQKIGQALSALGDRCTPQQIVDIAEAPDSVLHRYFQWDDKLAAKERRLWQAQHLIRSIEVFIEESEEWTRAFQSVIIKNGEGTRAYRPIKIICQHEDESAQVVAQAQKELEIWTRRWKQYRRLFPKLYERVAKALEAV